MPKTAWYLYLEQCFGNQISLFLLDDMMGRHLLIWVWQKGWTFRVN